MRAKKLTELALLTTVALIIFVVELRIPNPIPIPGVKLGLANIITVYAVYHYRATRKYPDLSKEENALMLDLAGKKRNEVAPDLPEYIMERDYVSAALRTARDLDAGEEEWNQFVEELRMQKG